MASDRNSGRRTAEQELRESEDRYRALAELSPNATFVLIERRFAYANSAAADLVGAKDASEFTDISPMQLVDPQYYDLLMQRLRQLQEKHGATQLIEYRLRRLDGSSVDVEAAATPISWDGKRAVQVVARDIGERKRVELELRASEARYRTLFHSIDEGFCVVEMIFDERGRPQDYRFLEVNPAFEKQTGLKNAEGKLMRELAPKHEEHWFEIYGRVATTGEPVRFTNSAGELRGGVWFDVNAFRVGGEESRRVGILFKDITERIRTEEEIRRLNARLETLVEQRTHQLMRANEELDSFNYSVSHDLRAPLRGVDGFAQALLDEYGTVLDDRARSYIERVRSGAQRMGVLIDDLLRLSRLSRSKLSREVVDLELIARDILTDLRRRDSERAVHAEIDNDLELRGDPGLLRVAMENLLENAWKFSRDRELIRIEVGKELRDGERVFFVRDNGAGFDSRYADKLFVPFGRLHSNSHFDGTGIGLAMVQRVVQLHGGRVWGSSTGEGATFYFTISE